MLDEDASGYGRDDVLLSSVGSVSSLGRLSQIIGWRLLLNHGRGSCHSTCWRFLGRAHRCEELRDREPHVHSLGTLSLRLLLEIAILIKEEPAFDLPDREACGRGTRHRNVQEELSGNKEAVNLFFLSVSDIRYDLKHN